MDLIIFLAILIISILFHISVEREEWSNDEYGRENYSRR